MAFLIGFKVFNLLNLYVDYAGYPGFNKQCIHCILLFSLAKL